MHNIIHIDSWKQKTNIISDKIIETPLVKNIHLASINQDYKHETRHSTRIWKKRSEHPRLPLILYYIKQIKFQFFFLQERLLGPEIWTYRQRRRRMEWDIYLKTSHICITKIKGRSTKKKNINFFINKIKIVWIWWFLAISFWLFFASCILFFLGKKNIAIY